MRRRYEEPPVSEVVCEFRFQPVGNWDFTSPGIFFQKVQQQYPKRQQTSAISNEVQPESSGIHHTTVITQRSKFLTEDEKTFLQLSPNYLSVHQTKPYDEWESFLPKVTEALNAYKDSIGYQGIQRIGLRYINKIEFNSSTVDMQDYFDFYPHIGSELPQTHYHFHVGVDLPCEQHNGILRLQLYPDVLVGDSVTVTLDLDYFTANNMNGSEDEVESWLQLGHKQINDCFEGSIKDPLRVKFKEVK